MNLVRFLGGAVGRTRERTEGKVLENKTGKKGSWHEGWGRAESSLEKGERIEKKEEQTRSRSRVTTSWAVASVSVLPRTHPMFSIVGVRCFLSPARAAPSHLSQLSAGLAYRQG